MLAVIGFRLMMGRREIIMVVVGWSDGKLEWSKVVVFLLLMLRLLSSC